MGIFFHIVLVNDPSGVGLQRPQRRLGKGLIETGRRGRSRTSQSRSAAQSRHRLKELIKAWELSFQGTISEAFVRAEDPDVV